MGSIKGQFIVASKLTSLEENLEEKVCLHCASMMKTNKRREY
jgi:hypothetical protein